MLLWWAIGVFCACVRALTPAPGVGAAGALFYDSSRIPLDHLSRFLDAAATALHVDIFDVAQEGQDVDLKTYDTIFVFPCKSKSTSSLLTSDALLQASSSGTNVLVLSDAEGTHTEVGFYLAQLGIHLAPKGYEYVEYGTGPSAFANDVVSTFNGTFTNPGVAVLTTNEHLFPLVRTGKVSKSYEPDTQNIWHLGPEGALSAAFQGANNARLVWVGSTSPFVDATFESQLATDVLHWVAHVSGVLRARDFAHVNLSPPSAIPGYKVGDMMHVEVALDRWTGDQWVPHSSSSPVQVELVMLDPYYRLDLAELPTGHYQTDFKLPNQHGVFTLMVNYMRPGWTYVGESTVVPVRHLANNEFPRSWEIKNAWVYLNAYGVVSIAWILLVVALLLCGPANPTLEAKKNV